MLEKPTIHESAFVADSATVIGRVQVGASCSLFFGTVLRTELDSITIGEGSNIQDNCVCHADEGFDIVVGAGCTIGHGAILHGCTIGENTLVGMGAIVLNGAVIGRDCIIGAGALVPQGAVIPDGSLVVGVPGKVRRAVTAEEITTNRRSAEGYVREGQAYKAHFAK